MTRAIRIRDEAHLRELHTQYFTASRLGALYGDGFTTTWQEYHILRGTLPPPDIDSAILRRGLFAERVMDDLLREERPDWRITKPEGFYPHPRIARFGATPDRFVTDAGGARGVAEYKTVAEPVFREAWADSPPLRAELQHQAQMACTGTRWGAIVALVIGAWRFDLHVFERELRPRTIERLERDVAAFLADVEAGREPAPDYSQDGATIAALCGESDGRTVDLSGDNRIQELCAEYLAAAAEESAARQRKDAAKAEILHKLGTAERAIAGPYTIGAKTVPGKAVAYVRAAYRGFRVNERKEEKAE